MKTDMRIVRGQVWGEYLRAALASMPGGEAQWMDRNTALLKSDTHSRVGLLQLQDRSCYLKFYQAKSAGQHALFRMSYARGVRSFDAALKLGAQGIPVPEPLSCLLTPGGLMLLTEGFNDGRDLKALWLDKPGSEQCELLMRAAASSLGSLHKAGFSHGDCKWSNCLWFDNRLYLVDLEGVSRRRKGPAADLARFIMNAEDLGVAKSVFEVFAFCYLEAAGKTIDELLPGIMPVLKRLRARHELQYGSRGHKLLGEIQDD